MNQYPMKCRISNEGAATRVDVYDDIGEGLFGGGVSATDFSAALAGVRGALDIHINSGGGSVWDGLAIKNAISAHKGKVTTVVDGLAASVASVIFQAGDDRVVSPGSMLMIHDAWAPFEGNASEMAKMAHTLDQVSGNIAGEYAARAGGTAAQWRDRMRAETWFTAEEAVQAGLADRVAGRGAQLPQGLDLAAWHMPSQIAASLRSLPVAAAAGPPEQSCAEMGHQCCRDAAMAQNSALAVLRAIVREEVRNADSNHPPMTTDGHTHSHPDGDGGMHSHEHAHDGDAAHADHTHDPDGDGDDDTSADGDTDHDYAGAHNRYRRIVNEKYSADDRKQLASKGHAMPDGSYPIADEEDLHNAIRAVGRGGSDHDAIRRHIIKRASALGASGAVPDNWNSDGSMKTSADNRAEETLSIFLRELASSSAGKE